MKRSRRHGRRPLPRLHVIAGDDVVAADDWQRRLGPVIRAGGSALALHLRTRKTTARRLFNAAEWLVDAARETGTAVFVNDRLDIALATGASGVHLREDSLPVAVVRSTAGAAASGHGAASPSPGASAAPGAAPSPLLIGRSIHAPEQARFLATVPGPAKRSPAQVQGEHPSSEGTGGQLDHGRRLGYADHPDYFVLGAVHPTLSHPGRPPIGLDALEAAARTSPVPVLAIGGVTPAGIPDIRMRGAHGVVVLSGVWGSPTRSAADLAIGGAARDAARIPPAEAVTRYLEVL